jgi:hypothetical protein
MAEAQEVAKRVAVVENNYSNERLAAMLRAAEGFEKNHMLPGR